MCDGDTYPDGGMQHGKPSGATATAEHETGVKDEVYNVVSISRMPKGLEIRN
jgi:hypothetical protein